MTARSTPASASSSPADKTKTPSDRPAGIERTSTAKAGPPPISAAEYQERAVRASALMADAGIDACVLFAGPNLRYFSAVPWGATERLVALVMFADGRRPIAICPNFEIGSWEDATAIDATINGWDEHENPASVVAGVLKDHNCRRVAVDPLAPWFMTDALQRAFGGDALVSAAVVADICRMHKSDAELALIQHAMSLTLEVHRRVFEFVRPGVDTRDVRQFIDDAHRELGADGGNTFCAVQFGKATAYPHGISGTQTLQKDELVLIDTGCQFHGYHSDITRSYVLGTPSSLLRETWLLEKKAQQAAFDAARGGATCESVDRAARTVVEDAGLGPGYQLPGMPHRTGHGIGLVIHEAPYLVQGDQTRLAVGMCFSNEPMIVVPGQFGVRLEDHFHVTADGPRWFTQPAHSITEPFG